MGPDVTTGVCACISAHVVGFCPRECTQGGVGRDPVGEDTPRPQGAAILSDPRTSSRGMAHVHSSRWRVGSLELSDPTPLGVPWLPNLLLSRGGVPKL